MKNTDRIRQRKAGLRHTALLVGLSGLLMLPGCATQGTTTSGEAYRCEQGVSFTVRFEGDSAIIDGTNGNDVLLRDAGGTTPQQTVFSNARLKAEFGLGDTGREAVLRYPLLPLVVRCVKG
jgi:hypothetical protein